MNTGQFELKATGDRIDSVRQILTTADIDNQCIFANGIIEFPLHRGCQVPAVTRGVDRLATEVVLNLAAGATAIACFDVAIVALRKDDHPVPADLLAFA